VSKRKKESSGLCMEPSSKEEHDSEGVGTGGI